MKSNFLICFQQLRMKFYEKCVMKWWIENQSNNRLLSKKKDYFVAPTLCTLRLERLGEGKKHGELLPSFEVIRWFTINRRNSPNLVQFPKLQYRFPVFWTIRSSSLWNIMLDRTLYVGLVFWNVFKYDVSLFWKVLINCVHFIELF